MYECKNNLEEQEEGNNPVDFFPELVRTVLGREHFQEAMEVDCCHRLGAPNNQARPRMLLGKLHSYHQKERFLWLAQQEFPLSYKGKQIHIFPDIPAEIMRQRQLCAEVRKKLKDAVLRTGFIYPACLQVTHGSNTINSPDEATRFADRLQPKGTSSG